METARLQSKTGKPSPSRRQLRCGSLQPGPDVLSRSGPRPVGIPAGAPTGGRAAVSVGTAAEYDTQVIRALARYAPQLAEAADRMFSLDDAARLRSLFAGAGFQNVATTTELQRVARPSFAAYFEPYERGGAQSDKLTSRCPTKHAALSARRSAAVSATPVGRSRSTARSGLPVGHASSASAPALTLVAHAQFVTLQVFGRPPARLEFSRWTPGDRPCPRYRRRLPVPPSRCAGTPPRSRSDRPPGTSPPCCRGQW